MDRPPSFAILLRELRLAKGLTQEALAERAGLSARGISDLERGLKLRPHEETIRLLAAALDLTGDEQASLVVARGHRSKLASPPASAGPPSSNASDTSPGPALRSNLPLPLTSFVGREREVAEVEERLKQSRLLTLTGPGGIGKTRLALEVAGRVVGSFPDGVHFVALDALRDPTLVAPAIGHALGLIDSPTLDLNHTLTDFLRDQRLLLVLDNFEQVIEAAELLTMLLSRCSGLTLLVTSRMALRVYGEHEYAMPPLALPTPAVTPIDEIGRFDGVRLFVAGAQRVKADFRLTTENAGAIVAICRRLDGLPLAIELAAARSRVLTPDELCDRLARRLGTLTGGARDLPLRQQTMRSAIDWSHELLSAGEQALFRRLSVFAGGFTFAAAEAVTEASGPLGQDLLDGLDSLVSKSLLRHEEQAGTTRFAMLEVLREYAQEKLTESGEIAAVRAAHAGYFQTWGGGPGPQSVEGEIRRLTALPIKRVTGELENLRAALGWCVDQGDAEAGLGLAARLWHVFAQHGPPGEGWSWLERLLALPSASVAPSRAAALYAMGVYANSRGDSLAAEAAFGEATTIARGQGDLIGALDAQIMLGWTLFIEGHVARARALLAASAQQVREVSNPVVLLESLMRLGFVALAENDQVTARAAYTEATEALPRFPGLSFKLHWLAGGLARADRDWARVEREHRAALVDRQAAESLSSIAISVLNLAEAALACGGGRRAARLLGGAEAIALLQRGRPIIHPAYRARQSGLETTVRNVLGEEEFAALRAEGRRMSVPEVVELAMEDPDETEQCAP